jgi:signal transduction histidine kinase
VSARVAPLGSQLVLALVEDRTREHRVESLRRDFVANVSHELKTPLALIRMFGETLESGIVTDEAKRQEFYAIIRRESDRLTHLINNVLDVARIDAGTKQYAIAEADIVALTREAIDAYQPLLDRLGFAVDTVLPDSPVLVALDRDAIAQALVNLFQNAIKYSGDVKTLEVSVVVESGTVRLSVADQGIGIVPAEMPRIFEKHYRIRSGASSALSGSGGSGLGLAIVKHAIEAHGGQVEVVSAPERGSTFTLVLPLRPAA